jgi:ferredoxin
MKKSGYRRAEVDSRCSGKPCSVCRIETQMGAYENIPAHARERWDGVEYVRFCGPECETTGGW